MEIFDSYEIEEDADGDAIDGIVREMAMERRAESRVRQKRRHPLYAVYGGMISRCYNRKNVFFKNYGGRGIRVCDRWRCSFWDFVKDVGERPLHLTFDRKNNNGNYEPENWKWSSREQQMRNTRRNCNIEIEGEIKTAAEWAGIAGISGSVIAARIRQGWSAKLAVFGKVGRRGVRARGRLSKLEKCSLADLISKMPRKISCQSS